jgi:hypothetical protein
MKNQTMGFQSNLRTCEASAAFAQGSQTKPESFKRGFKESINMTSTIMKRAICFTLLLLVLAVPGFAQIEPRLPDSGHPIPSAPKKRYEAASVAALPGLECKLYAEGSTPSKSLTVFTDDDGYARFHAVRATASDASQRLALDCVDSIGKSYSYLVDLTSDDTFTPRPLNLANERGTDRPALQGDPLSYSRSELIQAGYGLRPDPTDTAAYARWLAAASVPGRMLETKRPVSRAHTNPLVRPNRVVDTGKGVDSNNKYQPNTVHQVEEPWWVGATLNGAPSYISNQATFNVPEAIPAGDETPYGTAIAIWNGVDGGSALIQGGLNLQTLGYFAGYGVFREYCCGDPDSNTGTYNTAHGAFTPNPHDEIYSEEYYCDSQGNPNLNGGYGCTYILDETTGAILNCTQANGSPCASVKAVPTWNSFGTEADFVIEDQTPQLLSGWDSNTNYTPGQMVSDGGTAGKGYPYICLVSNMDHEPGQNPQYWAVYAPLTAFTDLSDTVNMSGSALSSTTGKFSQTVTTDPLVYLLVDFTNTSSHMNVSLGTTDETYFSVSQWEQVRGIALTGDVHCAGVGGVCRSQPIAVGPNAEGSNVGDAWELGNEANSGGDHYIYQWQNSNWARQPGAATQIAISPGGHHPWVINHLGQVFYWNDGEFDLAPGNACATSIGVGPATTADPYGIPWIIGCNGGKSTNGSIYYLNGSTWVQYSGDANQVAVSPEGIPWVLQANGNIFYLDGSNWKQGPGCATSIAVGPSSAPFAIWAGDPWIIGCNGNIYQFQFGASWVQLPGVASNISVSPDLGVPWIVNSSGAIFE